VFRSEDTDGRPLDYENTELPDLPLVERAKECSTISQRTSDL